MKLFSQKNTISQLLLKVFYKSFIITILLYKTCMVGINIFSFIYENIVSYSKCISGRSFLMQLLFEHKLIQRPLKQYITLPPKAQIRHNVLGTWRKGGRRSLKILKRKMTTGKWSFERCYSGLVAQLVRASLICQGCGFDPPSGHIPESTYECINKEQHMSV